MEYKTSSFPLATFLLCKGVKINGIENVDRDRKRFIFEGGVDRGEMKNLLTTDIADLYLWGKLHDESNLYLKVNVKEYEESRNRLLDLMNER